MSDSNLQLPQEQEQIQFRTEEMIVSGERYEFIDKNYQKAMKNVLSNQVKAYIQMLIVRCYFKLKKYRDGEEAYQKLLQKCGNVRTPDGTPLKIIGLSQLAETYALIGQEEKHYWALLTVRSINICTADV